VIVLATGYGSMNGWAAQLISQAVADKVGKVWGMGSGTKKDPGPWEGELRNMWKPTQQPGALVSRRQSAPVATLLDLSRATVEGADGGCPDAGVRPAAVVSQGLNREGDRPDAVALRRLRAIPSVQSAPASRRCATWGLQRSRLRTSDQLADSGTATLAPGSLDGLAVPPVIWHGDMTPAAPAQRVRVPAGHGPSFDARARGRCFPGL
jgi:hypothetical protein